MQQVVSELENIKTHILVGLITVFTTL